MPKGIILQWVGTDEIQAQQDADSGAVKEVQFSKESQYEQYSLLGFVAHKK